ncbi:DUF305 domain-containing protein [Streptomyces indicus]|uniref:Uncharacterized conserved protein, DUF305 family n=1 Tax=Streptomyces indicus TaxID=417292 RepID=A0A1G8TJ43_9ACTN|nr:DUF305 domain-containing protein [Streptomyces indicus]SDJ40700.1 Uncharacterized conserved protein, DUF305 family [Streptomyces indicus]
MLLRHRSPHRRISAAAAVALAGALLLGACDSGGGEDEAKSGDRGGASVIAPGKPGEKSEKISPEEAKKRAEDDTPNSADFTYAQMMIVHHRQALEMTELAPKQAKSGAVKKLAERIHAAQGPEIEAMEAWVKNNGGPRETEGHDHHTMPGMASGPQMKNLKAAKGAAFDELFLKLMITHHQGAITMAEELLSGGNNIQLEEMAADVMAQQASEVDRMRGMA